VGGREKSPVLPCGGKIDDTGPERHQPREYLEKNVHCRRTFCDVERGKNVCQGKKGPKGGHAGTVQNILAPGGKKKIYLTFHIARGRGGREKRPGE